MHPLRALRVHLAATFLALSAAPALAETFTVDFFPEGLQTNNTIQLRFLGPDEGQITQTRLFLDFTTAPGFNAEDLTVQLVAPVTPADPNGGFWFVTGEDLGWSGQGSFTATLTTNMVNGELHPGLWGFDLGSVNDPPAYSGTFSDTSRFEVDIAPIPEPGGLLILATVVGFASMRGRRCD